MVRYEVSRMVERISRLLGRLKGTISVEAGAEIIAR
jgi:hypothetical protein